MRVRTDTQSEIRTTWNIIADLAKGDADKVVMNGAHLGSVLPGPGINDNGSGSATLLELAMFKIYDGDDSDAVGAPAGPPGSDEIEKTFEKYFDALHIGHVGTDFDGRSHYGPFIEAGVPAGGLFTGAEGVKTAAEAAMFGGTADEAYDGCYHQACDTIANINDTALAVNTGAIAFSALVYAFSDDLPGPDTRPAAW